MTDYNQKALALFSEGYNCAQSVLGAFAGDIGIPLRTALRLTSGFGGGISRQGEVCGAVSGAVMVLGFALGSSDPEDQEANEHTYALVQQFLRTFSEKHTHVRCCDLLGSPIDSPEKLQKVRDQDLFHTICPHLVGDAAAIAGVILAEENFS
ncbi:MAG: C_GCAxxG_C_C family protein [Anaerolineales bacterium]|nr:C_GCAxxG_C_C family protein [Anaerolineales bacterium]